MSGELRPYPEYKDSGVEWLGEVPAHWKLQSLGSLTTLLSQRGRPDLPLLSVVREKGVIRRSLSGDDGNHNVVPEDLSNYKVVPKGALVINKMKAWQGSLGIAPMEGIVSPAYFVFNLSIANSAFAHALLRSRPYVECFGRASDGVRIGQWDLSPIHMKRIPLWLPPKSEQAAIVRYLNWVDRRIGRLIQAKRKLIALLEEQKQAIIHRAVTRGLNPNTPLKPSGIDWLGKIPGTWRVNRLKHLFTERDHRTTDGTETLLSLRIRQGLVPHNEVSNLPIPPASLVGYKRIEAGQFVMNRMRAAIGLFGLAPRSGIVSPDYSVFLPAASLCRPYFLMLFRTPALCAQFRVESTGLGTGSSGFMRLYWESFGNIRVPTPPLEDQIEIVETVYRKSRAIDKAKIRASREADLLSEYRTRLFSQVVTGKLDVQNAFGQASDDSEEASCVGMADPEELHGSSKQAPLDTMKQP